MDTIDSAIATWTQQRSLEQSLADLAQTGVPAGKVYTVADPHYQKARGMLRQVQLNDGSTLIVPGVVPRLSGTPGDFDGGGPGLGEHTYAVLRAHGLPESELAMLQKRSDCMSTQPIALQEVCMRDGLQMEPLFVATDDKVRLVDALSRTGLRKIEVTSFTSSKAIPALRDAEAVMGRIERVPGVIYAALVLNGRGAERALSCQVDELNLVLSASETHNLCNTRMTTRRALQVLREIVGLARGQCRLNVSIATAFGCPMEGTVEPERVLGIGDEFASLGVTGISLCDTTGVANPRQVKALCDAAVQRWPGVELTLHLHDTRGMGLANVLAGIEAGVARFDASLAGLGGCPYAPGASGNVCTEDLAHMLAAMGYDTGVDLEALIACSGELQALVGHEGSGQVFKAGPWDRRFAVPGEFAQWREEALAREAAAGV